MTRRVDRGGTMDYEFDESNISIEHIQRGINLPDWLFNYNLLKRYKNNSNVKFCSYENLCNQPEEWAALLSFLGTPKMIEYQF